MLSTKKIADHFGRTPQTVRAWVRDGKFPPPTISLPSGRPAWPDSVLRHEAGADIGGADSTSNGAT